MDESLVTIIDALSAKLRRVGVEQIPLAKAFGRVLAESISLDRDSPAADVSAMDGYAIRSADWHSEGLPVGEVAPAGMPRRLLPEKSAIQIFTGALVPFAANRVLKREDVHEIRDDAGRVLRIRPTTSPAADSNHIRKQGENALAGSLVLQADTPITSGAIATLATCGVPRVRVRRQLKIAILNTGEEVLDVSQNVEEWQIRDSNGPWLESYLSHIPWCDVTVRKTVSDDLSAVQTAIESVADCDCVLMTGGVSMGDADYVPDAIERANGKIVFHRIPIRPGKPVLGAYGPAGQLWAGLPGNPLSVATTLRCLILPTMETMAGLAIRRLSMPIRIVNPDTKQLDLRWFRLVRRLANGSAELVASKGSGDVISLANSDGLIEIPPNQSGPGPWNYHPWAYPST
jgi:molybdopterin molybdotransferase